MRILILLWLFLKAQAFEASRDPMYSAVKDVNTEVWEIKNELKALRNAMTNIKDENTRLQKQVYDQNQEITEQRLLISRYIVPKPINQTSSTDNTTGDGGQRRKNSSPNWTRQNYYKQTEIQYNRFVAFGCINGAIHLSCNSEKLINVTSAFYGEYHDTFNNTCPVPHPIDECQEYVPSSRPSDWVALKLSCENRTECDFEYKGSTFQNVCTLGKVADFMIIYYSCIPDDLLLPIGFSAQPSQHWIVEAGDHLLFVVIKLNLGSHYQHQASVFICPVNGIYLISVNVLSMHGYQIFANIYVEESFIASAHGDEVPNSASQGAMTTIVECSAGERIWLGTHGTGYLYQGDHSVFTGYLLNPYD